MGRELWTKSHNNQPNGCLWPMQQTKHKNNYTTSTATGQVFCRSIQVDLERFQNLFLNRERERNRCKAKGEILIWVYFYCFSQPSYCVPCLRSYCGISENYAQISSFPFNSLSPADIRLYSGVPSYCTKCFLCSNPHLLKDQYCLFLIRLHQECCRDLDVSWLVGTELFCSTKL